MESKFKTPECATEIIQTREEEWKELTVGGNGSRKKKGGYGRYSSELKTPNENKSFKQRNVMTGTMLQR